MHLLLLILLFCFPIRAVASPADLREYYHVLHQLELAELRAPLAENVERKNELKLRLKTLEDTIKENVLRSQMQMLVQDEEDTPNECVSDPIEEGETVDPLLVKWASVSDPNLQRIIFESHNRYILKSCLEDKDIPVEKTVEVGRFYEEPCDNLSFFPYYRRGSWIGYQIEKTLDHFRLSTKVYFTYKGNPARKKEAFDRMEKKIKPCIEKFFARQGFVLLLEFRFETGLMSWLGSDIGTNLVDVTERANASNWPIFEDQGIKLTDDQVCSTAIHELGHRLGLPDRYPDPDCPNRITYGEASIMADSWRNPLLSEFDTADLRMLLAPLCGVKR